MLTGQKHLLAFINKVYDKTPQLGPSIQVARSSAPWDQQSKHCWRHGTRRTWATDWIVSSRMRWMRRQIQVQRTEDPERGTRHCQKGEVHKSLDIHIENPKDRTPAAQYSSCGMPATWDHESPNQETANQKSKARCQSTRSMTPKPINSPGR